jgi:fatty acid desaturase
MIGPVMDVEKKQSSGVRRNDFLSLAHGRRNVADIILLHAVVILWMILGVNWLPFWLFIPLTLIICAVQQRQLSEWLHEGVHYNIHPSRKINEFVSTWVLAAFFGLPLGSMRKAHFSHHAAENFFDNGDIDTEYAAIHPYGSVFLGFLCDLCGLTAMKAYASVILTRLQKKSESKVSGQSWVASIFRTYMPVFTVQLILVGAAVLTGHFYAWLLYYAALVTIYPVLSRLRLYAQHLEINPEGHAVLKGSGTTRTLDANLPERMIFMSRLMQYHYEHHEWPNLPYRALHHINKAVPDNHNRYAKSHFVIFKALARGVRAL